MNSEKVTFIEEHPYPESLNGEYVRVKSISVMSRMFDKKRFRKIKHLCGRIFKVKYAAGNRIELEGTKHTLMLIEIDSIVIQEDKK